MSTKQITIDSISDFRNNLSVKTDEIIKNQSKTIVTVHGKPQVIVMSLDAYEDEIEQLSPADWKVIKDAEQDYKQGKYTSLESVLDSLNIEL